MANSAPLMTQSLAHIETFYLPYVLVYELEQLLAYAHMHDVALFAEMVTYTHYHMAVPSHRTNVLHLGVFVPHQPTHVGRVEIETYTLLGSDRDTKRWHAAAAQRTEQIMELLTSTCVAHGIGVRYGQLAQPGMFDDLKRLHTAQRLWRIRQTERANLDTRTLVILSEESGVEV